jgi:hypothetical protein
MNIDEIFSLWNDDSKINTLEVGQEALNIPLLHNKYITIFTQERMILLKLDSEYKQLYKNMHEYYSGSLDTDTQKELGLSPNPKLILKADISMHMDADDRMIAKSLRIGIQKEKIQLLDSILKTIANRGFQIKSYIDYQKFMNGE